MLASSFFFGKNVREKRERESTKSSKEVKETIRSFKSNFFTQEYIDNGESISFYSILSLLSFSSYESLSIYGILPFHPSSQLLLLSSSKLTEIANFSILFSLFVLLFIQKGYSDEEGPEGVREGIRMKEEEEQTCSSFSLLSLLFPQYEIMLYSLLVNENVHDKKG